MRRYRRSMRRRRCLARRTREGHSMRRRRRSMRRRGRSMWRRRRGDVGARCGDVGAQCGPRRRRSARRHRRSRGVFGDIGDYGVGITLQMCNRVTNHGGMSTFSKPDSDVTRSTHFVALYLCLMCQSGLHAMLLSHIGILLRLPTAEPRSTAGLLFPSQSLSGTIWLTPYLMVWD